MNKYDYLLVGAGLYNAVFAWYVTAHGKKCLVIDKRNHTGGNVHCDNIEGITVHCYGPHIFHTSNEYIWKKLNDIVPFYSFINRPLARYGNKIYSLPFNMNTFYQMWGCVSPSEASLILKKQTEKELKIQLSKGHELATNLEEQALRSVGRDIYNVLIKGYTEKQWGRPCSGLPPSIINRLPIRLTYDANYYKDSFQGIPLGGYNVLIDKMLSNSSIMLCCDFKQFRNELKDIANTIVFSGSIDEYFDYSLGKLEYRSLYFEYETVSVDNMQGNAVINYTDKISPYTRVIEHKHFEPDNCAIANKDITIISREYSIPWQDGLERNYPIHDIYNLKLFQKYKELAQKERNIVFGGRLGDYSYYDMDKVVEKALSAAKKSISDNKI